MEEKANMKLHQSISSVDFGMLLIVYWFARYLFSWSNPQTNYFPQYALCFKPKIASNSAGTVYNVNIHTDTYVVSNLCQSKSNVKSNLNPIYPLWYIPSGNLT